MHQYSYSGFGQFMALRRHGLSMLVLALLLVLCNHQACASDTVELPIRGIVKSLNQASLSADVPLRISRMPLREGDAFKKGDLLVAFDCRRQKAEMEALKGARREAELNVSSSVSLDRFKAIGRNDVEIARARLQKANGELTSMVARVEDCTVHAPFSGRIAEAPVRELEFTLPQRPYLTIVGDQELEIEAIVTSAKLASLTVGHVIGFKVDELQSTVEATISSIGAVVDPVSKTVKIKASVMNAPPGLISGMSGTVLMKAVGK